jgi:hypothetical protein
VAEAVVAIGRERLAEVLAGWPDAAADTTWAMGFVSAAPTAAELAALREAAKLCDRVVAARLLNDRGPMPGLAETLRAAGADIVWLPRGAGRVQVSVAGEKLDSELVTLLAQGLLTVLPGLVVVPRGATVLIRALRALQGSWGEFFSLRVVG